MQHPCIPEPRELPGGSVSIEPVTRKAVTIGQFAELEGEAASRSELDSSLSPPDAKIKHVLQSSKALASDGKTWVPPKEWHAPTASCEKYNDDLETSTRPPQCIDKKMLGHDTNRKARE